MQRSTIANFAYISSHFTFDASGMGKIDVVLFGADRFASLAWYCVSHDSPYKPVAFTVDGAYQRTNVHEGLPVLPFETLRDVFPPEAVSILLPLGYRSINGLRRDRFEQALACGYEIVSYVSSRASTWADLQVGRNVLVYENAVIQPFSTVGDNVIIRSASHISHHCTVDDHAFIAAGVTLGGSVHIGEQAFVGVGAVVRDNTRIAPRCFIGAGAVVVADTEPDGVYVGNPARRIQKSSIDVT